MRDGEDGIVRIGGGLRKLWVSRMVIRLEGGFGMNSIFWCLVCFKYFLEYLFFGILMVVLWGRG